MMKIVLAGPPRSGKSCLREGLKQAIRVIPGAFYPYVITACPDGEGAWFQETVQNSPELTAACKAAYKSKFTPEFVERIANSVKHCSLELTLIDIGGMITPENRKICEHATHIIILSSDPSKFDEWREFAESLNLTVLAEIYSDYHGTEDTVNEGGVILTGSVHYLERGELVMDRPLIKALARHIINLKKSSK